MGADLASIHGQTELEFLERYLTAEHYWVGLNDKKKEGTFENTDGTNVTKRRRALLRTLMVPM